MTTDPFPHLRAALQAMPWAITPERLLAVAEVVERRCAGVRLSPDEIASIKGKRQPNGTVVALVPVTHDPLLAALSVAARANATSAPQQRMIAVINMHGTIAQHAASVDDVSGPGGTSTERLSKALAEAVDNPSVSHVVLNIDSGGGTVYGVPELAAQIFKARERKPIVAQVNSSAGSAAYWLASQASHIAVTPSGEVGSLGVFAMHQDVSKAAENAGVKFSYISAGKHKVDANPHQPLSDQAAAHLQETVDSFYHDFVADVARGRGRPFEQVLHGFGEGRMVRAKDAVRMGMADSVATLDETLRKLAAGKTLGRAGAHAEAEGYVEASQDWVRGFDALQSTDPGRSLLINMQPVQPPTAFSFAEALATAQEAFEARMQEALAPTLARLDALKTALDTAPTRYAAGDPEPAAAPVALTSPLMQKCPDCGCNMEAETPAEDTAEGGIEEPGNMNMRRQAAAGMNEGDTPPPGDTTEHPQSSKMQKCPDCGKMREPPPARDGTDGGAGAAAIKPDPEAAARYEMRKRRHAQRQAARALFETA